MAIEKVTPNLSNGIELYVSNETGKSGASQVGLARLCGISEWAIRNTLSDRGKMALILGKDIPTADIFHEMTSDKGAKIVKISIALVVVRFYNLKTSLLLAAHLAERGIDIECIPSSQYFSKPQKQARKKKTKKGFVYLIGNIKLGFVKIGFSAQPLERLKELQTSCPYPLFLINQIEGTYATEAKLHKKFSKQKIQNEWFKPNFEMVKTFDVSEVKQEWL